MNSNSQELPVTSRDIASALNAIQIKEVETKKDLKTFLELPRKIYIDPKTHYVMPLEAHIKMMLGKIGQGQKHAFIAYKDNEPVARLAVKTHTVEKETRLHFGFFECDPKSPEAAQALINKAHSLYPSLEMMGPFQFRQEDPYIGTLVEGFDLDPYFMMTYNHQEYDQILKQTGMEKAMDLFTYQMIKSEGLPQLMIENAEKAKQIGVTFRAMNGKKLRQESRIIAGIFNEALSENWGFEEFLEAQIDEMVLMFKFFVDPRVVIFALHEGKEIGCLIMIPDYNHLIKPSRGKLNLGLLVRYFGRAKTTDKIRGYALGVLKKYQKSGIGSALTREMFRVCGGLPYETGEISWVLANNGPMNDLSKAMGGKQNKVYRVYKKEPIQCSIN